MPNGIRWIPNEEIQQHAEEFLSQYWDDTLPVDVEYIAEYCLKISVLPLPGLKANIEGDGFITRDFKEIHLDFDQQAYEFAGCLLVPQHHLQHTFDVLLPEKLSENYVYSKRVV